MDKLKRYDMNVECDSRSQSSEYHWVEEEQNHDGEWVRYSEVRDEIEKLEKQNQMMLDVIKEAVNGYYSCPDDSMSTYHWRIITELLEKTLQDVEGQQ